MPRLAEVVTAIILERPFCMECIAARALVTAGEIERILATISGALRFHRSTSEHCRGCGNIIETISVDPPSD